MIFRSCLTAPAPSAETSCTGFMFGYSALGKTLPHPERATSARSLQPLPNRCGLVPTSPCAPDVSWSARGASALHIRLFIGGSGELRDLHYFLAVGTAHP